MNIQSWKFRAALVPILGLVTAASVFAQAANTTGSTTTTTTTASTTTASTDQQAVQLEKYTVTGSNIPSAAEALAVPVVSINADQIDDTGVETSTLDIIRKVVPSISGIGTENANINTAQTYGGAELFIHGLPALVLVNGQRVATSSAAAVGADTFVDLNLIPPAAIQSIEVLQDGASAIYGSDALGGVINITLKKDYNGWDTHLHWGESPNDGHYNERTFSIVGGVSNDKNSITISAEYSENPLIMFSQRPDTATYGATTNIPGVIDIFNEVPGGVGANPVPAGGGGGDEYYILAPGINAPPGGGTYTIQQLVSMGIYQDLGNTEGPNAGAVLQSVYSHLNLAAHQTLESSLKREAGTADMEHKFSDALHGSVTFLYSRTITESTLNAQPLFPQLDNPTDPYLDENLDFGIPNPTLAAGDQFFSYTAASNPFSLDFLQEGETMSTDTDGNGPYPSGNDVTAHNRLEAYPRIFQNTSTQVDLVGELDGKIAQNYSWTGTVDYSRTDLLYQNFNVINANLFQADLNNGTLNPFAINQAPGVLNALLGTANVDATSDLTTGQFIFNGSPFDLPAGKLSFAVGTSFSREVLNATADLNSETNGWVDAPSIKTIDQQRKWFSYFGELEIPILGDSAKFPGVYDLNVDLAYRNDDYYGVGDSKTPKVSLKYEPFSDDFAIRASAGKSFLSPPLFLLYGPTTQGASQSINYIPFGQTQTLTNVQFEASGGSNPNLKPAKGTDWTLGFIWDPKMIKGLDISFDYFDSVTHDFFSTIAEQTIIQSVEDLGPASPYNDLVHFGNISGPSPTAPGQVSTHPAHSVWIINNEINVGSTSIKGWDATVNYSYPTLGYGKFDLTSQITFYNSYMFQAVPSENYYQYAGTASVNVGTVSRYRTYTTLGWSHHGFKLWTNNTWIPSVDDVGTGGSTASPPVHVSSYLQEDFAASYKFAGGVFNGMFKGITLSVGVDNAFNRNIPIAVNAFPDTFGDVGNYNGPIGRMYYADFDYKF